MAVMESELTSTNRTLDQWINRGVGVWAAAAVIFAIVQFGSRFLK
jgi:hypothetical protein